MPKCNCQTEKFTSTPTGGSLDNWFGAQLVQTGGLRNRIMGRVMPGLPGLSELGLLPNSNVLGASKAYSTVSSAFE